MALSLIAGLIAVLAAGLGLDHAPDPEAGISARPAATAATLEIGRSAQGRPLRAVRVGSPRAPVRLLVVGSVHGDEPGGLAIARRLRELRPPRRTAVWVVEQANPDGAEAGTRQNANGVDLNRNFPYRWTAMGAPFDTHHAGPAPLSEPESQALAAFAERIRPRVSLWYHQALKMVVDGAGDGKLERLYARESGLPLRELPAYTGTAVSWQTHAFAGDTTFVVELPGGRPAPELVDRHARAALALARAVAPPRVVRRPIPYDAERRADMRAYARRHYGIDDDRLRHPRVIVEHYTVTETFEPVWNTFAQNVPDVELGELPGVCAHYVIDRDGTVYELVPTTLMCRHTVGLNWTAIGIEHVGNSDAEVLGNRRQRRASLRLTRMLQGRYGIEDRNVIGHNESLSSPFHRERVASLRTQTHGDFDRRSMKRYRSLLRGLPAPASLR